MALSRVKTWIAGETLTAADLNAEFSNILDNPLSLISPLSAGLDFDGNVITLDSDADTTITADTDDRIDFAVSGADLFRMDGTATTPVNGLTLIARATGSKPSLQALTSDANEGLDLRDDNGNEILILSSVASAANEITITAAAAGSEPSIAATGDDTDIDITLTPKGAGDLNLSTGEYQLAGTALIGTGSGQVYDVAQDWTALASSGTVNIGGASSYRVNITGTTTITAFDTVAAGIAREVRFDGALTLTHNGTSLILPTSANISTASGDVATFVSEGSGNWRCVKYVRADGYAPIGAPTAAQGASVVLLASYSPSAAASVDVTSVLTSTYKRFRIELYDFVPASDDVELWMRTSTDNSTFDSGASDYAYRTEQTTAGGSDVGVGDTAGSKIVLAGGSAVGDGVGSAAGEAVHVTVELYNPLGTALNKVISWSGAFQRATSAVLITVDGRGSRLATADIDAVQFLFESGNIESGEVRVYGIKDS